MPSGGFPAVRKIWLSFQAYMDLGKLFTLVSPSFLISKREIIQELTFYIFLLFANEIVCVKFMVQFCRWPLTGRGSAAPLNHFLGSFGFCRRNAPQVLAATCDSNLTESSAQPPARDDGLLLLTPRSL